MITITPRELAAPVHHKLGDPFSKYDSRQPCQFLGVLFTDKVEARQRSCDLHVDFRRKSNGTWNPYVYVTKNSTDYARTHLDDVNFPPGYWYDDFLPFGIAYVKAHWWQIINRTPLTDF